MHKLYHVLVYLLMLTSVGVIAGELSESNVVLISSPGGVAGGANVSIGSWLEDKLVICDLIMANKAKVDGVVKVTFLYGTPAEFSVMGKVEIKKGPGPGFITIPVKTLSKKHAFPKGFKLAGKPLEIGQKLKIWRKTSTGIRARTTKIKVCHGSDDWICRLELSGYPSGSTGFPVTTENGELAGTCYDHKGHVEVAAAPFLQKAVNGCVCFAKCYFEAFDPATGKETLIFRIITRDPLRRMTKGLQAAYWIGPHHAQRKRDENGRISPNLPGDGPLQTVPLNKVKTMDDEWKAVITVTVPHGKVVFVGGAVKGDDGTLTWIASAVEFNDTALFAASKVMPKDFEPYKESQDGLTVQFPAAEPDKEYPAKDLSTIDLKTLFPHKKGNAWLYHRSHKYVPRSIYSMTYGFCHEPIMENGQFNYAQRFFYESSTHDELYTVSKQVGDRFWLTVQASKKVPANGVRDGRFAGVGEYFFNWKHSNGSSTLESTRKIIKKDTVNTSNNKIIMIENKDLKVKGNCSVWKNRHRHVTVSLRGFDSKTPAGIFHGCVMRVEKGTLKDGVKYEVRSFYYPGVGLVSEIYDLVQPKISGNMIMTVRERVYELKLKGFKVTALK